MRRRRAETAQQTRRRETFESENEGRETKKPRIHTQNTKYNAIHRIICTLRKAGGGGRLFNRPCFVLEKQESLGLASSTRGRFLPSTDFWTKAVVTGGVFPRPVLALFIFISHNRVYCKGKK